MFVMLMRISTKQENRDVKLKQVCCVLKSFHSKKLLVNLHCMQMHSVAYLHSQDGTESKM